MATVIVAEASASGVAATIWSSIVNLNALITSRHGYVASCESLRVALLRLHDRIKNLKEDEQKIYVELVVSARIAASKAYAVVEKIDSRTKSTICCFTLCGCFKTDVVPARLENQEKETQRLVDELAGLLKDGAQTQVQEQWLKDPGADHAAGVNTLQLTTGNQLDSRIRRGKTLSFDVRDSNEKVCYTVKTWINNPKSWLRCAKSMSASVERQHSEDGRGKVVYDIQLSTEKDKGSRAAERMAFISISGSLQAQVKSVLPDDTTYCCGKPTKGAGTLLQRGHLEAKSDGLSVEVEYQRQTYSVELLLTNLDIRGLAKHGIQLLRVVGKKLNKKVEYVCFVEQTGEVLAIYRHSRSEASCGSPALGVTRFLGVGNKQEVRDLLLCTFVAMGLTSDL